MAGDRIEKCGVAAERRPGTRASRDVDSLFEMQQKERSRLAFDIHDGPAQSIAGALLQLRIVRGSPEQQREQGLDELERLLLAALDDLYAAVEHLRSRALDRDTFVAKIQACADDFSASSGIPVTLSVEDDGAEMTSSLQIALFQIVNEALQNIRSHADASHVAVSIRITGERAQCVVEDDGKGFDPHAPVDLSSRRAGYGLSGMRERARLLGGKCRIESRPGEGCRVWTSVPIWRG